MANEGYYHSDGIQNSENSETGLTSNEMFIFLLEQVLCKYILEKPL